MFTTLKWYGLSALCLLCGLMLVVMSFTEPDFTMASRIFSFICGLIFLAGAVALLATGASDLAAAKKRRLERKIRKARGRDVFTAAETVADVTETDSFLHKFREDYAHFFTLQGTYENTPLQMDTTQLYWNVMALQKKRLDRCGIQMRFTSERKAYPTTEPLSEEQFFDGKYEVAEYDETVATGREYVREGNVIGSVKARRIAHIGTIHAKAVGKQNIICPNCGAETTRENLIDGCDYCGTKFKVEDLGTKVSSFRLRGDYELYYAEYRENRAHYNEKAFFYQFIVYFILMFILGLYSGGDSLRDITYLLATPMAAALAAAMFAFLGLFIFWPCIFPLIQAGASINYYSKKQLDNMRIHAAQDKKAEGKIRESDPLFSVAGFYSNLHNKLAVIHYADTLEGINAFMETDGCIAENRYRNVIDMDMIDAKIRNYSVADGLQQLEADTELILTEAVADKISRHREKISLLLVKEEGCKTQEICEPSVLICKGCGSSIALENGKTCRACGKVLNLQQYDWVIRKYDTK